MQIFLQYLWRFPANLTNKDFRKLKTNVYIYINKVEVKGEARER